MTYDPDRDRVVAFGGRQSDGDCVGSGTNCCGDLWEWDGQQWSDLTPGTGPAPRQGTVLVYDSNRKRIVMFGGRNVGQFRDIWEWDGASWVDRTPIGTKPDTRYSHAMAFDPRPGRNRVVMFGGWTSSANCNGGGSNTCRDTWEWDGDTQTWTERIPTGAIPSARYLARMVYDPVRARVVLYGGAGGDASVWEWDGVPGTWTEIVPAGTSIGSLYGHEMVYDARRQHVVLFGGYNTKAYVWDWDGTQWLARTPMQASLRGRAYFGAAYDSSRERLFVLFGVASTSTILDDMWVWDDGPSGQSRRGPASWPSTSCRLRRWRSRQLATS